MADQDKQTEELLTPEIRAVIEQQEREDQELIARYRNIFTGTHSHSLDSKGRIIVPNAFRDRLGKTFVIGPSYNFQAIALYPTAAWARLRDGFEKMGHHNRALNEYLEQFDALCYMDQECDAQGRVLLPSRIRQKLLKSNDVEIAGAGNCVRIVARESAEKSYDSFIEKLPDVLDAISALDMNMLN